MACAIDLHVDTPTQSLVELNMYKNDVLRRRISHAGCFMGTQFSELPSVVYRALRPKSFNSEGVSQNRTIVRPSVSNFETKSLYKDKG